MKIRNPKKKKCSVQILTTVGRDALMHDDTHEPVAVVGALIFSFQAAWWHVSIHLHDLYMNM
jgi:hypothetical protein